MAKKGSSKAARAQRRAVVYRKTQSAVEAPAVPQADDPVATATAQPVQSPRPVAPAPTPGLRAYSPLRRHAGNPAPVPVDYRYVRHDLVRISVLTGIIVVILGVLTVFLR